MASNLVAWRGRLNFGDMFYMPMLSRHSYLVFILFAALTGCAGNEVQYKSFLYKNELIHVNNICIVGQLQYDHIQLFDTSKIRQKQRGKNYGSLYGGGILGLLVGSIAADVVTNYKLNMQIDEPIDTIENGLANFDIQTEINKSIMKGLDNKKYRFSGCNFTFKLGDNNDLKILDKTGGDNPDEVGNKEFDILIVAKYTHGLSVAERRKPIAIVTSEIEIFNAKNKVMLSKRPLGNRTKNESHTILEYSRDNSLLYKNYITNDAERIGELIATSFPSS